MVIFHIKQMAQVRNFSLKSVHIYNIHPQGLMYANTVTHFDKERHIKEIFNGLHWIANIHLRRGRRCRRRTFVFRVYEREVSDTFKSAI